MKVRLLLGKIFKMTTVKPFQKESYMHTQKMLKMIEKKLNEQNRTYALMSFEPGIVLECRLTATSL